MTHTLHRQGTEENLREDFVLLCLPAVGVNDQGASAKLREFLKIALRHNPVNIGDPKTGNMYIHSVDDILSKMQDRTGAHAVFTDADTVAQVLKEVKEADLGMSLVLSSLFDAAETCCRKAGLKRHTVEYSLGVWGKTEKLPPKDVLEVTTMCGHGMVSSDLVSSLAQDIKRGKLTAQDAATEVAKQCCCGIFNLSRATRLLSAMAKVV